MRRHRRRPAFWEVVRLCVGRKNFSPINPSMGHSDVGSSATTLSNKRLSSVEERRGSSYHVVLVGVRLRLTFLLPSAEDTHKARAIYRHFGAKTFKRAKFARQFFSSYFSSFPPPPTFHNVHPPHSPCLSSATFIPVCGKCRRVYS